MSHSDVYKRQDSSSEEETDFKIKQDSSTDEDEGSDYSDQVDENDNVSKKEKPEKVPATLPIMVEDHPKSAENQKVKEGDKKSEKVMTDQMKRKMKKTTQTMVTEAISALNERSGSSAVAIKNYILANFEDINDKRIGLYVYKYLKKSVTEGTLKQNKRKFKLVKSEKANLKKFPTKPKSLKDKTSNPEKSTKTTSSSKGKVIAKTVGAENAKPKKVTKTIQPSATADVLKSTKSSKKTKSTEPSTSSTVSKKTNHEPKPPAKVEHAANTKAKVKPGSSTTSAPKTKSETKRALYTEKESVISVKKPRKVAPKGKIKIAAPSSEAAELPSTSKQSMKTIKFQKTKK